MARASASRPIHLGGVPPPFNDHVINWKVSASLAVIGFRAELDAHGAVFFADVTSEQREFARMCPAAHCFAVVNAALDIDPGFVAAAISRPSEKRRIARAGRDRFVADAAVPPRTQMGQLARLPPRLRVVVAGRE